MKQIATKINKFITFLMFVIESCVSTIGEDFLLLAFLIVTIIPNIIIKATSDMSIFNLRSLFFNFAWYSLIVALSFNYKTKKSRIIYFSLFTTLVYVLTYSNLLYYRYYTSFLSLSLVKQLSLFSQVADATAVVVSKFDQFYWSGFVLALVAIVVATMTKHNKFNFNNTEVRMFNRLNFLRLALISFAVGILTLAPANYSEAEKMWNRPIVVENLGLYDYHIIDIFKSIGIFFNHKPTETEYVDFLNYFDEKNSTDEANPNTTNQYTDILKGQNLIIIHAESLENFLINATMPNVNGDEVEITPNFNKLASESLYFSNFYSQQSIGTSADSEFVFNSSLLPINNGTVYLTDFDNTYVTTQNLLQQQGYLTMYMHGNNASFWNRDNMYKVMGYDVFYSKNYYAFTDNQVVGLGIGDYDFFQQSIDYIANAPSPYLALLITLSNHTPWNDVDKYITKDAYGNVEPALDCAAINLDNTTTCRYLESVHYADWAFGQFMDSLKEKGLLDNTAVVIYGDHPASLPITDMDTFYGTDMTRVEYKAKAHVPFMIYDSKLAPQDITKIMGEYDVGPTLQNMLGIKNQFALGHDIFSIDSNIVPFVNGDWTDGIIYYDPFRSNDYYIMDPNYTPEMIDQMVANDDYITKQTNLSDSIIAMSNMINKYDLIGYYESKQATNSNP